MQLRLAIRDTLRRFVGKREGAVNNSGVWIIEINSFWHLPARSHYCAAALAFGYAKNGVFFPWVPPVSVGRVRAYFRDPSKIVWVRGQRGNSRSGRKPQLMDWASLFASHTEALAEEEWDEDAPQHLLIGFNTSGGPGTRDGCYLINRRTRDIKMIANHLTPYLAQLKRRDATRSAQ